MMMPGATALTRTPSGPHSTASVLVMLMTPARAAEVCAISGNPFQTSATMLTIASGGASSDAARV